MQPHGAGRPLCWEYGSGRLVWSSLYTGRITNKQHEKQEQLGEKNASTIYIVSYANMWPFLIRITPVKKADGLTSYGKDTLCGLTPSLNMYLED